MDQIEPAKFLRQIYGQYKYALLILVLGLVLMVLPKSSTPEEKTSTEPTQVTGQSMQEHLEQILSRIEGAGQVAVLLSEREGEQTIYQTDIRNDSDESGSSEQADTVILTDSDRNETGLVRRTDPPRYLGAIIVCQGADRAEVRLALVEAVQCVTGLGANQISVVKMK